MSTPTDEIARRRTFSIISHPDAGKTILTEKPLLFGGGDPIGGRLQGARRTAAGALGGIQEQTRRLFEVCRPRDLPIIALVNKLDREGDSLDLLDEIEPSLALDVTPACWPISVGRDFLGTHDRFADALSLFECGVHETCLP